METRLYCTWGKTIESFVPSQLTSIKPYWTSRSKFNQALTWLTHLWQKVRGCFEFSFFPNSCVSWGRLQRVQSPNMHKIVHWIIGHKKPSLGRLIEQFKTNGGRNWVHLGGHTDNNAISILANSILATFEKSLRLFCKRRSHLSSPTAKYSLNIKKKIGVILTQDTSVIAFLWAKTIGLFIPNQLTFIKPSLNKQVRVNKSHDLTDLHVFLR